MTQPRVIYGIGITPEQAKVAVINWVELMNDNFVTKPDFDLAMKDIDLRFNQVDSRFEALETKMNNGFKELETKMDNGFNRLDSKIDNLGASVDSKLEKIEQRLMIRLGSLMIVGISLITALNKI